VTRRELLRAIQNRVRPRGHGLAAEMMPHVIGERRHGRITFRGRLLQRLRDDRVEISATGPPQALERRAPRGGDAECRRPIRADQPDRVADARRLAFDERADLRHRVDLVLQRRVAPSEHLVEQDAQRVDVCSRRDCVTRDLFRRGISRCQRRRREHRERVAFGAVLAVNQLGDAEVEQLHPS
jgi:hypothetical protein